MATQTRTRLRLMPIGDRDGRSGRWALPVKILPTWRATGVRTRLDSVRPFGEPALLALLPGTCRWGGPRVPGRDGGRSPFPDFLVMLIFSNWLIMKEHPRPVADETLGGGATASTAAAAVTSLFVGG